MSSPRAVPTHAAQPAPLDTRIRMETPEGIDLLLRPAGLVPRAVAFSIDLLIRVVILALLFTLLRPFEKFGMGLGALALFLVTWWYMVLFEVLNQGRSPGKAIMGLRVIHDDGTPIGWSASLLRNLLRFVDMLPLGYSIGAFACLQHPLFKRLGDLAAGTLVIHGDIPIKRPDLPDAEPMAAPVAMTLDEQRAILSFAERQTALSPARTQELATILTQPLHLVPAQAVLGLNRIARGLLGHDSTPGIRQSQFETRHQPDWQAFAQRLDALERSRRPVEASESFAADYRRICQQLALAQERGYSSHLVDPLHQLAMRGHRQLYRHRSQLGAQLLGFVLAGFPRLVRAEWRLVVIAGLLFFGSLVLMGALVYGFPDLVYSVVSPAQVGDMEAMYDPAARRIGQAADRGSSEDWMMFGYYIMHNIGIGFQTFASGLLFGLGSLFFLFFNGLMIGAVAGHLTRVGYGQTFWSFVVGHGAFELTAIALSGAAGLKLGWALLAPGALSRSDALRVAARTSVRLIAGVILFLLIAAFIEAYWSSMSWPTPLTKYLVGAALWAAVAAYLLFAGRNTHAPD